MKFKINAVPVNEQMYSSAQSHQLLVQTGCIGYLHGDFGYGQEFHTSWRDHQAALKSDSFMKSMANILDILRQKGGLLHDLSSMREYCWQNPDSKITGHSKSTYGFKIVSDPYTYMLRCDTEKGDYNFYLYAYVSEILNNHLEQAKQGIRFMDARYREIFRIDDGDEIRIITGGGGIRQRVCRYIDSTHFETSGGYGSSIYHICEFADRLERSRCRVIPIRASLPNSCFSILPDSDDLIVIQQGETGYTLAPHMKPADISNREFADMKNRLSGVSKAQEAAMLAGSMFGWQLPSADPKNYDAQGHLIACAQKG